FVLADHSTPAQPVTGSSISHHFDIQGTYYVSVTATDKASPENHGLSNFIPITVTCNPQTDPHRCGKPPPRRHHHQHHHHHQNDTNTHSGPTTSGTNDGGRHHQADTVDPQGSANGGPDGQQPTGGAHGNNGTRSQNHAHGSSSTDHPHGRKAQTHVRA